VTPEARDSSLVDAAAGDRNLGALVAIAVALALTAGLALAGLLLIMGAGDKPTAERVVTVEGDQICFSPITGSGRLRCGTNTYANLTVEPGDCVLVSYRHGVSIDSETECP
jgi:hypothetical protein